MKLRRGQRIHLVGIGGSGLSAIARILLGQGYRVSGSDRSLNPLTEALARDGAIIYQGHDASNVNGTEALIITSAVKPDHVEVAAALEKGIPVYKRQDIIADLMEGRKVIAVAGTKGKTTTTSMIVHILRQCGYDPSYIVGGVMGNTVTNAGVGMGNLFVIEADEYENMFLGLKPDIAVITNIEWDHPDFFKTPEEMLSSFEKFVGRIPGRGLAGAGTLIACVDDPQACKLLDEQFRRNRENQPNAKEVIGYSTEDSKSLARTYLATNIRLVDDGNTTVFDIEVTEEQIRTYVVSARIRLPGQHNVQNALASFVVTTLIHERRNFSSVPEEACKPPEIVAALVSYKPPSRRFELRADINRVAIIDDYAHNPMSIRAVLQAARQRYPDRQIWAVWQPHTYSRTQALMSDYLTAFDAADHVLVTDIYAARESPMPGVTSAAVVAAMEHPAVRYVPAFEDAVNVLRAGVKTPAAVIIMSAGDAPEIGVEYLKRLRGDAEPASSLRRPPPA